MKAVRRTRPLVKALGIALPLLAANAQAATLAITAAHPAPVLGIDHETDVSIEVKDAAPGVTYEVPELFCTVGRVEAAVRRGPHSFTARYVFPEARFPQAAILVARMAPTTGPPTQGALVLPLRAVASPGFRTDPGAEVTLTIGDRSFGPKRANEAGEVRIAAVVPPGIAVGVARSVNRYGKVAEESLDLALPEFARVLLVPPSSLVVGETAEAIVYAVDRAGQPIAGERLRLFVGEDRAHPLDAGVGARRFLVPTPTAATGTPVALTARITGEDGPHVADQRILPIAPGRAASLTIEPDRQGLRIGSFASARVVVRARDVAGNPAAAGLRVYVGGREAPTQPGPSGSVIVMVPAPVRYDGRDRLLIEAIADLLYARGEVTLLGVPRRRPRRPAPPDPVLSLSAHGGLLWTFQQGTGAALTLAAHGRARAWPAALLFGVEVGCLASRVFAGDATTLVRADLLQVPLLLSARWRRRVRRSVEFRLGAGVGINVVAASLSSMGERIFGLGAAPAAALASEASFDIARGQLTLGLRYLHSRDVGLSRGDRIGGNPAGLVADVGYRWQW